MDIHYGRKRNGIIGHLNKKMKDWIDSIQDEELRKLVHDNAIVTGGSIASMLMGDKINDYDVYMRTKEAAVALATYYVKQYNDQNDPKNNTWSNIKPYVKENTIVNIKDEEEEVVQIHIQSAGVTAEGQSGYEYFENRTNEELKEFTESLVESLAEERPKYRPVFMSQNAITLSDKIQVVLRFYGEPDEIHRNYDFIHAQCYFDLRDKALVTTSEALEAMMSRTLVYTGSLYPLASIFRTKKFVERGWRITAGQLLKIMWQISEIDLTNQNVLREQLTGVDMAYMYQLIEALKSVEPDKINSTYVAAIIDKIFE